jgi:pimeloyl-ACP methyl ester carboxylesterase
MKHIFLTCMIICAGIAAAAQDITGSWQGTLPVGGNNVRLIFHITGSANNYAAKFDSPDQHAYGISCSSVTQSGDSIAIGIMIIKGIYRGKWNGANEIDGVYAQGDGRTGMDLKRLSAAEVPHPPSMQPKPQTPKAPFNYTSEEVGYENIVQHVHLAGTLTKPTNGTGFPVVLLITGSGPQDRDESIGMHKPFLLIADHLAKLGIAVLRVDDRSMGKSTGDFSSSNTEDFATDVMAGIDYLKTRKDIDATKIGLLGHSEGAMIAPYVATRSKDVAFIVMLAGPVVGGKQTMYFQAVEKALPAESPANVKAYGKLYNAMTNLALDPEAAKNSDTYIRNTYLNWKKEQPDSTIKALIHGSDEAVIKSFTAGFSDFKRHWWNFFLTYDLEKDIRKLQIPVFALNGEKDEQVDPKANLAALKSILTKNGNRHFKTYEVPGVNHLFQHCKNCGSVEEYLALEETFDSATLHMIGDWIKEQVK